MFYYQYNPKVPKSNPMIKGNVPKGKSVKSCFLHKSTIILLFYLQINSIGHMINLKRAFYFTHTNNASFI